jgi:[ribosomal protein S5]-alanine N-acetyltransferase
MNNPYLVGKQVYLRPLEREDAPQLVSWFNDPEVSHNLLAYRPMTRRAEEEFLDKLYGHDFDVSLGIVVKETDRLIGVCGFKNTDPRNRHTEFGIAIGEKGEWGKGHGTEATRLLLQHAFETLNLNRVGLYVVEFNERAIRSYDKVGFRREGVLRQSHYRRGRYWDTLVMAMLREDWDALQSVL